MAVIGFDSAKELQTAKEKDGLPSAAMQLSWRFGGLAVLHPPLSPCLRWGLYLHKEGKGKNTAFM